MILCPSLREFEKLRRVQVYKGSEIQRPVLAFRYFNRTLIFKLIKTLLTFELQWEVALNF